MAKRRQQKVKIRVEAYEEIRTKVAGVTHEDPRSGKNRQELIRRYIYPGMRLIAKRDPKNPYGRGHAVMLLFERRRFLRKKRYHLGYLPEGQSENVDKLLQRKVPVEVVITAVTGGTDEKPTRGVNIVIRYPL